eukprot:1585116-Rhodomonas_salina.1
MADQRSSAVWRRSSSSSPSSTPDGRRVVAHSISQRSRRRICGIFEEKMEISLLFAVVFAAMVALCAGLAPEAV